MFETMMLALRGPARLRPQRASTILPRGKGVLPCRPTPRLVATWRLDPSTGKLSCSWREAARADQPAGLTRRRARGPVRGKPRGR
ncbi:hypothetical protein [Roseococcus pinisoli]|uniref:Uncharacterized protein n=1 Tax=Roseococcus pinisoli TaxID=2835040 RepID=A0ABS5QA52_9PROT|nr:hypothetical protein [Roseococcus pinisoli]MBS7810308.1 hypothetical protein [Roseococcus pinisoli]